jgi:hypothetical protein
VNLLGKVLLLQSLLLFAWFTSGVGLVLVCGGFYLYDSHDLREKKVGELISIVELLASSSNSALGFDDPELGNQVLDSMRVHPGIRSAVLYKETGQIFAWYVRRDLTGAYLPLKDAGSGRELGQELFVVQRAGFSGTEACRKNLPRRRSG